MKATLAAISLLAVLVAARGSLAQSSAPVTPQGAPPTMTPSPPPDQVPAPPVNIDNSAAGALDTGQWIDTSQYGWIWAPYGDEYVYTPPADTGDPYLYAYYPGSGWRWIVAPWVWGAGPMPYFSAAGSWHYHWYRGPAYYGRSPTVPLFRGGFGGGRGAGGGHHRR